MNEQENGLRAFHSRYPHIPWDEVTRGHFRARFCSLDSILADTYASNAWVIPFTANDGCVLTGKQDGRWWIPGGTLEPGEHWLPAAHREIYEEIGANILQIHPFSMYDCVSTTTAPLRPHLPHPRSIRVVSWATVEIVATPPEPDGKGGIADAYVVPYSQTVTLLRQDYPDLGNLYEMAHVLKQQQNLSTHTQ